MTNEKATGTAGKKGFFAGRSALGRRKTFGLIAVVALVLCVVVGYPLYLRIISHESTDDAFVEAQVVSISPRVAGHVANVLVTDNQRVEKGDLLAEVDPRDFEVALKIAEAKCASAAAAMQEAEAIASAAGKVMEQKRAALSSYVAELAQARAGVAEFEAGNNRDKSDLERMKKIAQAGAVSRQEYDHARAQAAVSRAKLNSAHRLVETQSARTIQAQAAIGAAEDELHQAQAQVEIKAADLREAEAEVERARLNLSYAHITAPCSGYVTKKTVEPGAYVQVGQQLFAIVNSDVWVVANFKETQISDMRPGQPVEIEVDAYPGVPFKGHVDSIQRGTGSRFTLLPPENATGNFIKVVQRVPVKIVLDAEAGNDGYLLAPGMSVVPSVDISAGSGDERMSARSEQSGTAVR
ncbi:HlyD family efflux transporter periplasmic adaptor subunit [Pseudodesulfovibrio cashew]|uniref:HlyD family efflux transporter periplasmic adaptor subunit n=1 Tax=Pseudodesulfovibrio cashew TaxID=2678688 RepID=A0A6I6JCH9_9BACT|nr:HlyD family secretion protein [Pseudodesulfovibrio cashew]QGY40515.1 HlyD family efflux transporter periplasmic adaptor subunit [Pseudodesulfovibrio cashew]